MGGIALKFVSPGRAGVYDRIAFMPFDNLWLVELKSKGKKLSPLQEIFKKQMQKLGFKTREADTDEKLIAILAEIRESLITVKPKLID